ncbi:HAMP domain-containing protein [bacterium]|nr:HAMP domain-containing protein [candidate division CSSED10-310 bacterium]
MERQRSTASQKHRKRRQTTILAGIAVVGLLVILSILEYHWLAKTHPAILALLNFNVILLILLIFLIFRNLIKMYVERSRQKEGSRFRTKLVLAFTILTLVPTLLLALIGTNLIATAVQNWFDPQIGQFVDDSMEIARMAHHQFERRVELIGSAISAQQQREPEKTIDPADGKKVRAEALLVDCHKWADRIRTDFSLETVQVFSNSGKELCRSAPENLPTGVFAVDPVASTNGSPGWFTRIVPIGSDELIQHSRRIQPIESDWGPDAPAIIVIGMKIPGSLASRIRSIQSNYEAYKQQKQVIRPTQGLYVSIFLLISLTILFAALWVSLYFARQISDPIAHLSRATMELARGNYDVRLDIQALDELGDLVRSFNSMTGELRNSRNIIQRTTAELTDRNREIDARRSELEAILSTIKAGVIALDGSGCIRVINAAATAFLSVDARRVTHTVYDQAFAARHLKPIVDILDRIFVDRYKVFQSEIQVETGSRLSTYAINVTPLVTGSGEFSGVVIVLNDMTQLLRMQRIAAWREVARRLAHEIKNPLTPIQLNTQRLQKKFHEKAVDFEQVFESATQSIVDEVQGLRRLLDEFSQFARMPEARLQPGRIDEIIAQSTALYAAKTGIVLTVESGEEIPDVNLDAGQMKQVMVNLIDNAVEAMHGEGQITIRTSYDPVIDKVRVEVSDSGPGVPEQDRNKLFLPYFSTKGSGSGLGLAICSRIVTDHEGGIRVKENVPTGARFIIELPPASWRKFGG